MTTETLDLSLLKVSEVAKQLRVSKMTVYRLCEAGEIPYVKVGHSFRIRAEDLKTYLGERSQKEEQQERRRLAYRAFNAGAAACYDIPSQGHLDAAFARFMEREADRD